MSRPAIIVTTAVAAVAIPSIGSTGAATAVTVGVSSASAQAGDQRPCVSQREYRDVQVIELDGVGWRQARVADHFDRIGTRIRYQNIDGAIDSVWKYRKCSPWGPGGWYVAVWYDNYSSELDGHMRAWQKAPNRPYALGADFFGNES